MKKGQGKAKCCAGSHCWRGGCSGPLAQQSVDNATGPEGKDKVVQRKDFKISFCIKEMISICDYLAWILYNVYMNKDTTWYPIIRYSFYVSAKTMYECF